MFVPRQYARQGPSRGERMVSPAVGAHVSTTQGAFGGDWAVWVEGVDDPGLTERRQATREADFEQGLGSERN